MISSADEQHSRRPRHTKNVADLLVALILLGVLPQRRHYPAITGAFRLICVEPAFAECVGDEENSFQSCGQKADADMREDCGGGWVEMVVDNAMGRTFHTRSRQPRRSGFFPLPCRTVVRRGTVISSFFNNIFTNDSGV